MSSPFILDLSLKVEEDFSVQTALFGQRVPSCEPLPPQTQPDPQHSQASHLNEPNHKVSSLLFLQTLMWQKHKACEKVAPDTHQRADKQPIYPTGKSPGLSSLLLQLIVLRVKFQGWVGVF